MENQIESQKKSKGTIAAIIILVLLVLGLGSYIVYDKVLTKENTETKEKTKTETEKIVEEPKEDLNSIASILVEKLDKYYVDYYDSKENVDFRSISDNDKMLGAYSYSMHASNSLDLKKSMVDDYYKNLFGITLTSYPNLDCWGGDGALFSYNSSINEYEKVGNHMHGSLTVDHSVAMKYNNIEKNGDNYIVTVTKVYGPSQSIGLESPENAFYADSKYTTKVDGLSQFTNTDNMGIYVVDKDGAKNYYEQNYEQFKNIKPHYKYTFIKENNNYYLAKYELVK